LHAAGAIAAGAGAAVPDTYPSKPIRFIVPYPTGGAPDLMARMIGTKLTERWGQQVLVDNRAGANGVIATETTAHAPRDGYTLMMGSVATHGINPAMYAKAPFDSQNDFTFITQIGFTPMIIVANPSVKAGSIKELIALAKAKPGQLTFGSSGSGSVGHLAGEMFNTAAGVQLTHVPYKGMAIATTDLIGGQISLTFGNILNSLPYIKAGRLIAIGVTSTTRSPVFPDVQAVAEVLPGFEAILWWGVMAPAGLPKPIADKLHTEILRILNQPEMKERWAKEGTVITGSTREQLAAMVRTDRERWGKVVKSTGARVE